jgi:hypothetical protein
MDCRSNRRALAQPPIGKGTVFNIAANKDGPRVDRRAAPTRSREYGA